MAHPAERRPLMLDYVALFSANDACDCGRSVSPFLRSLSDPTSQGLDAATKPTRHNADVSPGPEYRRLAEDLEHK